MWGRGTRPAGQLASWPAGQLVVVVGSALGQVGASDFPRTPSSLDRSSAAVRQPVQQELTGPDPVAQRSHVLTGGAQHRRSSPSL